MGMLPPLSILPMEALKAGMTNVGRKAWSLKVLADLGLPVPPLVAISTDVIQTIVQCASQGETGVYERMAEIVLRYLRVPRYAVRSCALIEDQAASSQAGQFLTRINVHPRDMGEALRAVITQAVEKGMHTRFSVMVQEYIPADLAGVTFTRHPSGDRRMVVEYHAGIGELLVSGRIKPRRVELFWTESLPRTTIPNFSGMVEACKRIERTFGHPQDIEWCYAKNVWHLLQSRPITTINAQTYEGMRYLDATLPSGSPFLFERTELVEIAPRPTPFTLGLLKKLYAEDGPIDRVYRHEHVLYSSKDLFRLLGNQLYIDRESEIRSLFPSQTYFHPRSLLKPHRKSWSGWWRSSQNARALRKMAFDEPTALFTKTEEAMRMAQATTVPFDRAWEMFIRDYEVIFSINLQAQKAVTQAETVRRATDPSLATILGSSFRDHFFAPLPVPSVAYKEWKGNGLEIEDETAFHPPTAPTEDAGVEQWWTQLPAWRQQMLMPFLRRAVAYTQLRECGRWLTVCHINALRRSLRLFAVAHKLVPNPILYGATPSEIVEGRVPRTMLAKRLEERRGFENVPFPARLTNVIAPESYEKPMGISAGIAEGILVSREQAEKQTKKEGGCVLAVSVLSPDIVRYFETIDGIVTESGGLLSHLAILAREQHVPVVTNVNLVRAGLVLGDRVRMDGSTGDLEKI